MTSKYFLVEFDGQVCGAGGKLKIIDADEDLDIIKTLYYGIIKSSRIKPNKYEGSTLTIMKEVTKRAHL